jgi:hypothetical protein
MYLTLEIRLDTFNVRLVYIYKLISQIVSHVKLQSCLLSSWP